MAAPITITGRFDQTQAGELDIDLAGVLASEYGSIYISGGVTLNGELNLDVSGGFTLMTGQAYDILGFNADALTGDFDSLLLDGQACVSTIADTWTCGTTVFNEVIDQSTGWIALDVTVSNLALPDSTALPRYRGLGFLPVCKASRSTKLCPSPRPGHSSRPGSWASAASGYEGASDRSRSDGGPGPDGDERQGVALSVTVGVSGIDPRHRIPIRSILF